MENLPRYCLLAALRYLAAVTGWRGQQGSRSRVWWKPWQIWRKPLQSHCCVLWWRAHHSSCLSGLGQSTGALPAAWLLEAIPRGEALGVQQELADKATGTDSYMFRGCLQLSVGECSTKVPAVKHLQVLPAAAAVLRWSPGWWLHGYQEGWVSVQRIPFLSEEDVLPSGRRQQIASECVCLVKEKAYLQEKGRAGHAYMSYPVPPGLLPASQHFTAQGTS